MEIKNIKITETKIEKLNENPNEKKNRKVFIRTISQPGLYPYRNF